MALHLEVTNDGDRFQYRAGYAFEAGATRDDVHVPSGQYNEIAQAPNMTVKVLGADSANEIPEGADVKIKATDAARREADKRGVDILAVPSTGDQITAPEVKAYADEQYALTRRDFIPIDSDGNPQVSTLDPIDKQRAAQKASLEAMREGDERLRAQPQTVQTVGEPEAPEPDATNRTPDASGEPVPTEQEHAASSEDHGRNV